MNCTIAALLTKVLPSSLFPFTCWTTLDTRGLESASSSWTLSQVTSLQLTLYDLHTFSQLGLLMGHDLQMKALQPPHLYQAVQPTANQACGTRSPAEWKVRKRSLDLRMWRPGGVTCHNLMHKNECLQLCDHCYVRISDLVQCDLEEVGCNHGVVISCLLKVCTSCHKGVIVCPEWVKWASIPCIVHVHSVVQ